MQKACVQEPGACERSLRPCSVCCTPTRGQGQINSKCASCILGGQGATWKQASQHTGRQAGRQARKKADKWGGVILDFRRARR